MCSFSLISLVSHFVLLNSTCIPQILIKIFSLKLQILDLLSRKEDVSDLEIWDEIRPAGQHPPGARGSERLELILLQRVA